MRLDSRHGAQWVQRAIDTLHVLIDARAKEHFPSLPGLPYCTAIFFSIQSDAHIVEEILKADPSCLNQPV